MNMYAHPMDPRYLARPVDARWQHINDLVDEGRGPAHEYDDVWIKRGWAYYKRLRASTGDPDREQVTRDYLEFAAAYRLHSTGDKLERAIVEARLLAGQSIADVATAPGLTAEAVAAYEAVFFQVIGRPCAPLDIILEATDLQG
jgi:hypothetical protein